MLIKADGKAIEWRAAVDLSKDEMGIKEILEGLEMHSDNMKVFGLPERRLAKIFLYRMIYGGNAPGFTYHPDFSAISTSIAFWEGVIERLYKKYPNLKRWQDSLMRQAAEYGFVEIPTGRRYQFRPDKNGNWPRTQIVNYPVQGFAADLMIVARKLVHERLLELQKQDDSILEINTVHDDIEIDVDNNVETCYNICIEVEKAFIEIADSVKSIFEYELSVPILCEIKLGKSLSEHEMFVFKQETFEKDWNDYNGS